jgi:hypothetical protein
MLTDMLGYHVKVQLQQNLTFYLFMQGNTRKAITPNAARSSKLETKRLLLHTDRQILESVSFTCRILIVLFLFPASLNSNNYRLKGPSALDSHSTRSNRMDLQVSGKQKSRC